MSDALFWDSRILSVLLKFPCWLSLISCASYCQFCLATTTTLQKDNILSRTARPSRTICFILALPSLPLLSYTIVPFFYYSQTLLLQTVRHCWDQKKCPYYRVPLSRRLLLRKIYQMGPRKLSVITGVVRIKRVSVKWGSTVPCSFFSFNTLL